MPRGRSGGSANMAFFGRGFTYNFGIAIASRTINQLGLLNRSTLSLAGALYGLGHITSEYTDALKQNTLAFGGQLRTIKAMQFAQQQLLAGVTEFSTSDIMDGMRSLMSAGLDARKNFKFISDAAQATGQSFSQFAGAVHQAIAGNMSGLVQMGLMTERATRGFDRYYANTVSRQKAIMNFLQANKNLQLAISQSFKTISGQWRRIMEGIKMFAQAIMGNPQDPNSMYQHIVHLVKSVADFMHKHSLQIRKAGAAIGMVVSWIIKQVEFFVKFIGKLFEKALGWIDNHLGNFKERMFSLILWLELWKVHIVAWVKDHQKQLLTLLKVILLFWGAYKVFGFIVTAMEGMAAAMYSLRTAGSAFGFITSKLVRLQTAADSIMGTLRILFSGGGMTATLLEALPIIGAIVAAGVIIYKNWDLVVQLASDLWDTLKDIGRSLWQEIKPVASDLGDIFKLLWDTVTDILDALNPLFIFVLKVSFGLTKALLITFGLMLKVVLKIVHWILKGVYWGLRLVGVLLRDLWGFVVKIGEAFWSWVPQGLKDAIMWVVDKVSWLFDKIEGIGNWFKNLTKSSSEVAKDMADAQKAKPAVGSLYTPATGNGGFTNPFGAQTGFVAPLTPTPAPVDSSAKGVETPKKRVIKNPLSNDLTGGMDFSRSDFGGGSVSIGAGAVQINVQKGQNIDEYKLKTLVEQALVEIVRKNKLMQGK